MKKMSDVVATHASVGSLEKFSQEEAWDNVEHIPEPLRKQVYLTALEGPLFFGFTTKFQEIQRTLPTIEVMIIRMSKVPYIDQSGIYALEESIRTLKTKGVMVLITKIRPQPKVMLTKIGVIPQLIPSAHLFVDFRSCIKALAAGEINQVTPSK
jgi:SulP family sulfate permease